MNQNLDFVLIQSFSFTFCLFVNPDKVVVIEQWGQRDLNIASRRGQIFVKSN